MYDVSIIIPVYNVEKYIDRCIESVLKQTLENYEVILVDDGSSDNCPIICDSYAEKYKFIRVIHKKNGGLSSARNAGLNKASGKYIGFVDSDDDIAVNMYEQLFEISEKYDVDFAMSDYLRVDASGTTTIESSFLNDGLYNKEQIREKVFPYLIMGPDIEYGPLLSVWRCLYKRDFLTENHICFDEEVYWSEDNIFSAIVGYYADSFYYVKNKGLYHYYQNPGSITTSYRKDAWVVYTTMNRHLRQFFQNQGDYDFSDQLNFHLIYYACNCINQAIITLEKKEALLIISEILSDLNMKKVFESLPCVTVPLKLRIQLELMKRRYVKLLYWIRKS